MRRCGRSPTAPGGVVALRIEDRQVTGVYYVRNPEKLSRLERETALTLR
ncbi:hypothetical protein [Kribbella sp. NPDC050459]